jgi:two-component system response regulator AgrA
MNLFILEDEQFQLYQMEKLIVNYLKKTSYPIERVIACSNSEELFSELDGVTRHNLYFLDITIHHHRTAGLEIAQKIRQLDPLGQITFVTTYSEFATITYDYKVNAHDFINKSLPKEEFEKKIRDNIEDFFTTQHMMPQQDMFSYTTKSGKKIEALYSDIYYFEVAASSHQILLQMTNESISFYGSLTDIEQVSDRLIRTHRTNVVNQDKIKFYAAKEKKIILEDDTELEVSRRGARLLKHSPKRM